MHAYESYWNMLPMEIQDYILMFKISPEAIDEEKKELVSKLCKDIEKCGELKLKWDIGQVKCIVKKGMCFSCHKHHLRIYLD